MPGKLCGSPVRSYIKNAKAYCEGHRAQTKGEARDTNPHSKNGDPVAFEDWDNGWSAKQGIACCGRITSKEQLVNGGFEEDLTGWQSNNAVLTRVESYQGVAGGVMRIDDAGANSSGYQTFSTVVGRVYEARANVNAETTNAFLRASNVADIDGSTYIQQDATTATDEWQELVLRFTAEETTTAIRVQAQPSNRAHVSRVSVKSLCQVQSRYVWFETNAQSTLDQWKPVADEWYKIGDNIATARRSNVIDFVGQMLAVVDEVQSGFKTSDFFDYAGGDNPYDSAIWGQVADLARQVYELTGKPVLIENEGNITNWESDFSTTVDSGQLRNAIKDHEWPPVWLWPGPSGDTEPRKQMYWDFAIGWQSGVHESNLIEPNSSGFETSFNNDNSRENRQRTDDLDDLPRAIHYLDNVAANFWHLDSSWEATQYAGNQISVIYPGIGDINNYAAVQASFDNRKC